MINYPRRNYYYSFLQSVIHSFRFDFGSKHIFRLNPFLSSIDSKEIIQKKRQQIIATNEIISERVNARTITAFQEKEKKSYTRIGNVR